uniref:RING-type domain-containing protein n=1 Tax=Panagrellus redivivus TaxID=6233 RepID=A0A7E4VT43_PANRE
MGASQSSSGSSSTPPGPEDVVTRGRLSIVPTAGFPGIRLEYSGVSENGGTATSGEAATTTSSSSNRTHQRRSRGSDRTRPMSAYVNELYRSSALTGTEEQLIQATRQKERLARIKGLLDQLAVTTFTESCTEDECAICMIDFELEDQIRRLPCRHTYHVQCIDDWLQRSFTCPSCMEPVDSALLTAFTPKQSLDLSSFTCTRATVGPSTSPTSR